MKIRDNIIFGIMMIIMMSYTFTSLERWWRWKQEDCLPLLVLEETKRRWCSSSTEVERTRNDKTSPRQPKERRKAGHGRWTEDFVARFSTTKKETPRVRPTRIHFMQKWAVFSLTRISLDEKDTTRHPLSSRKMCILQRKVFFSKASVVVVTSQAALFLVCHRLFVIFYVKPFLLSCNSSLSCIFFQIVCRFVGRKRTCDDDADDDQHHLFLCLRTEIAV